MGETSVTAELFEELKASGRCSPPLDDPSQPSATGHFTIWGSFNDNGKSVNGTFTFTVHGTFEDGSTFSNHVTDHFHVTPNGAENFFTHCND